MNNNQVKTWAKNQYIMVFLAMILGGCVSSNSSMISDRTSVPVAKTESAETPAKVLPKPPLEVPMTLAENWQENNHVHGLAVAPENANILYVATHHGLVQRSEDGKWYLLGSDRADYMGFAAHPTDSNRFYSSGHPHNGGNLGFRITENRGKDWQVISMNGVDFHALAIAPSNPDIIYGWATSGELGFFVSQNAGKNWTPLPRIGLEDYPFSLVVHPQNPEQIYATTGSGLYYSINGGKNWELMPETQSAPIAGLAIVPQGETTIMYAYRLDQNNPGIYQSLDQGKTWELLEANTGSPILYLVTAPNNSQILYGVNQENRIFQSQDGGKTWKTII